MPATRLVFWLGFAGNAVYILAIVIIQPTPAQVWRAWLSFVGAIAAVLAVRHLFWAWQLRRVVRALRSLGTHQPVQALSELDDDDVREALSQLVEAHGSPEQVGDAERFMFSPIDRRERFVLKWLCLFAALAILLSQVFIQTEGGSARNTYLTILGLCAAAASIDRTERQLSRAFEVSREGLTEIWPDDRRSIRWSSRLELRDQPLLRQIVLRSPDDGVRIAIPYSVVGFRRLLALVISQGAER